MLSCLKNVTLDPALQRLKVVLSVGENIPTGTPSPLNTTDSKTP